MGWFYLSLLRWGIPDDDPEARAIGGRLAKVWPRLSVKDQVWLMGLARSYADAVAKENTWNPKAHPGVYDKMKSAVRLSGRLLEILEDVASAGDLPERVKQTLDSQKTQGCIGDLRNLRERLLSATSPINALTGRQLRAWSIRELKALLKRRTEKVRWELVGDLIWLASGKKSGLSDRTLRRDSELPSLTTASTKKTARRRD